MTPKIDKKELNEPDTLQSFFIRAKAFTDRHRRRIIVGTGVFVLIVVIAGGGYLYQLHYESSAAKVYTRVFEASTKAAGSPTGATAAMKGYKELIAQYPRSQAAATAVYKLGNLYYANRDIDAAITAYQDFLKKAPKESDLVTLTYHALGSCYEIKKDFNKALEYYALAIKTKTASSFQAMNYGSIARVYEAANQPGKAVEFYRKALEKTKDPSMTLYLKRKISILG